ncbi:MAG TPA: gephyrin-like molybdotransferase Glp [Candidatus Sulfotelmatobacter sp.]|nr:gephyrin-like molybdotransferase Glp [Candidatus Sulfotelmatobacter sp.]HWI56015.1 gephyrin-like molybdotransferase Glp [Bacillota bacterium]
MLALDEALGLILAAVPPPASQLIPLAQAQGRILAEPLTAPIDLPPFDNSAMDGYAVRAADVGSAQPEAPVGLRQIGKVAAGASFSGVVTAGTCVRLFTGSPLPRGADAVVMQEDTQVEPGPPETILIRDAVRVRENVRLRGEDIQRGSPLAAAGESLTAGRRSLLAATGLSQVRVGRPPVVGLLATGSELQAPGQPLDYGQIYESNSIGLAALVQAAGGIPRCLPLVADVLSSTRTALAEAFQQCDAVVTSGGVSVGELDFLKRAFQDIGGELQFWKVAIKPGKPFVFGRWGEKLLFGLPGNPVSAFVTFLLLVRPALRRWQGATEVALPRHPGLLAEPLSNPGDRRHFLRVRVDAVGRVFSAGPQASHILSGLAAANGLVDLAPQTALPAGATIEVLRWE